MDDQINRLHAFELLLDSSKYATETTVELNSLRRLCARGIPPNPPHLRPLSYALLLGSASPNKRTWRRETKDRRRKYYDLVRIITADPIFQGPVKGLAGPESTSDTLLASISKDIKASSKKYRFLNRKSEALGKSNPLAAFKRTGKGRKGSKDTFASSSSESDGSDALDAGLNENENEAQARGDAGPSRKTKPTTQEEPIKTRRVLVSRLEQIAAEEYRIKATRSKQNSLDSVSVQNGGAAVPSGIVAKLAHLEPVSTANPSIVLSPTPEEDTPYHHSALDRIQQGDASRPISPAISLTTAQENDDVSSRDMSDSITLLKSQEIRPPTPAVLQDLTAEIELSKPDTHGECLIRLLYIFFKSHKEWTYDSSVVEIVRALYTVFASGGEIEALDDSSLASDKKRGSHKSRRRDLSQDGVDENAQEIVMNGWARHAEAETFWALIAFMGEVGDVVTGSKETVTGGTANEAQVWSAKLARRLMWADEGLYRVLAERHLSPVSTNIYSRWLTTCFTGTFPIIYLLPVLDFIFSEIPASADSNPKMDTIVDMSTALLILIRNDLIDTSTWSSENAPINRKDMWGNELAEEIVFDMRDAHRPEHERKLMSSRETELIRHYPIEQVGVDEVLRVTWEIRQQRVLATMEGQNFDDIDLGPAESPEAQENALAAQFSTIMTNASNNLVTRWNLNQVQAPKMPKAENVRHSLNSGEQLFRQYASNMMDSDAAANVAKASTNLSAAAKARWSSPIPASAQAALKDNDSVDASQSASTGKASSIWGNMASVARQASVSVRAAAGAVVPGTSPQEDTLTPLPPRVATPTRPASVDGANLHRRDTSLPPSFFISPRGSIVYPAGRYRPKTAQNESKPSLQDRLASAATRVPSTRIPVEKERTGIKPLMLSGSVRPASPMARSASIKSAASGRESPLSFGSPGSVARHSLDIEYYVPRKISLRRTSGDHGIPVSSVGAARNCPSRRGVEQSAARLRTATSNGIGLGRPSRQGSVEMEESPAGPTPANQRYALADPGTSRPQSPEEQPSVQSRRYQLSDAPVETASNDQTGPIDPDAPLSSATSGDGASAATGITRKGKVSVRPSGLRLKTAQSKEELRGSQPVKLTRNESIS